MKINKYDLYSVLTSCFERMNCVFSKFMDVGTMFCEIYKNIIIKACL